MAVHNHGTEDGEGLACREILVNGELKGACLRRPYAVGAPGDVAEDEHYEYICVAPHEWRRIAKEADAQ